MSQAENTPTTTRRNAMRLGAAATVTGLLAPVIAIAIPTGPDAELIAQCGETTRLRGAMNAVAEAMMGLSFPEADALQDDLDRTTAAYCEAVELTATLAAVSPAGVRAKAAILQGDIEEMVGICGGEVMGDATHKLAWSLACDLAAVPA